MLYGDRLVQIRDTTYSKEMYSENGTYLYICFAVDSNFPEFRIVKNGQVYEASEWSLAIEKFNEVVERKSENGYCI